ncbi:hypothetical protein VC33_24210 [Pseudomonas fluorescens]|jgi:hypothetical protein|nr:hypothetical protein VC33_24210 [Pseudomonas fluorescens]OOG14634.1 hypothetical protein BMS17_21860 [Pseudomonas sp. C9]
MGEQSTAVFRAWLFTRIWIEDKANQWVNGQFSFFSGQFFAFWPNGIGAGHAAAKLHNVQRPLVKIIAPKLRQVIAVGVFTA